MSSYSKVFQIQVNKALLRIKSKPQDHPNTQKKAASGVWKPKIPLGILGYLLAIEEKNAWSTWLKCISFGNSSRVQELDDNVLDYFLFATKL